MPTIFIDGEAGTTGLKIRERLEQSSYDLVSIAPPDRKNAEKRQALMAKADVVILCLPDEAAREAVKLAEALGERAPRILDASTAHRTDAAWTYGFPELEPSQPQAIARARRVSNPGCYATGAIALLRPLIYRGVVAPGQPISINAVSGYSGGGRQMIEAHEAEAGPAFELYALGLVHKHVPEIMQHAGLTHRPIFVPSVGHFAQGMLVSIPLHLQQGGRKVDVDGVRDMLRTHYAGANHIAVCDLPEDRKLDPQALNDTDDLQIFVGGVGPHAVLVARLDNLGKGAAGAAVQNLHLMLENTDV